MSAQRIQKQRQQLEKEGYNVIQQSDTVWQIFIQGPEQTPFEGGQFELQFKLDNFPFKGPLISFITKIYHPNVNDKGQICADLLETGQKWSPTKKLAVVMNKIKSMLIIPDLQTPINQEAAKDYKNNSWSKKAKQCTLKHAKH